MMAFANRNITAEVEGALNRGALGERVAETNP